MLGNETNIIKIMKKKEKKKKKIEVYVGRKMVGESLKVAGKPSRFLAVSINIMGSECISSWEEDSIELLVWL